MIYDLLKHIHNLLMLNHIIEWGMSRGISAPAIQGIFTLELRAPANFNHCS